MCGFCGCGRAFSGPPGPGRGRGTRRSPPWLLSSLPAFIAPGWSWLAPAGFSRVRLVWLVWLVWFRPGLVRTPAWPGPSPAGMLLFRSQSRVREFCFPPGGFGRLGGLRGRQVCAGARRGCFAGGPSPVDGAAPALPGCAFWVPPGISLVRAQSRVQAFCRAPGGILRSGAVRGRQARTGRRGVRFTGAFPCGLRCAGLSRIPSWAPAGMALFLSQGRTQAARSRPGGFWDVRSPRRPSLGAASGPFLRLFFAPYI